MPTALHSDYTGIICPMVTPFEDGEVDLESLESVVEFLIEGGVTGLMPCGTTGEFAALSRREYADVVERTVEAADGRAFTVPGALSSGVDESAELIDTIADLGAEAALVTNPYFYTSKRPAGNERFFRQVMERTDLPLMLYNQPRFTGQVISPETVAAVATEDSVVGLKDSGGDIGYYMKIMRDTPEDFLLFQGFDNLLLPGTLLGGNGGVVALANALPSAVVSVLEASENGDLDAAREIHENQLIPLFELCYEYGFATVSKAILAKEGVIASDEVRPPLLELSDEELAEVDDVLEAL